MAHELQERYSNLVLAKLRSTSIFINLFNKKYEGDPKAGAVKIPVRDTEAKVNDYDKVNGTKATTSTTTYVTLPIDKDIVVNELVDGYEAAAVPDNLIADRIDSAGYSLGKYVDDDLINLLSTEGTALTDTAALTKSNVYDKVVDVVAKAKKLGLRTDELWLAVTNETYATIQKSPEFIRATQLGDNVVQNGFVGKIGGVDVYETNNIPDDSNIEFILGNMVYAHYVDEWNVPVKVNDIKDAEHVGASAIQGRRVYGKMITKANTILVKKHA